MVMMMENGVQTTDTPAQTKLNWCTLVCIRRKNRTEVLTHSTGDRQAGHCHAFSFLFSIVELLSFLWWTISLSTDYEAEDSGPRILDCDYRVGVYLSADSQVWERRWLIYSRVNLLTVCDWLLFHSDWLHHRGVRIRTWSAEIWRPVYGSWNCRSISPLWINLFICLMWKGGTRLHKRDAEAPRTLNTDHSKIHTYIK